MKLLKKSEGYKIAKGKTTPLYNNETGEGSSEKTVTPTMA